MLSVVKYLLGFLLAVGGFAQARELKILVLGEGAAANCNEYLFKAVPHVFQFDSNGNETPASDPLTWAGCSGGSVWVPVGMQLVRDGVADRVIFLPLALPVASVRDWLPGGKAFGELKSAVDLAKRKEIRFDYVFWQQGYSDNRYNSTHYFNDLRLLMRYVTTNLSVGGWLVAKGTGCPGVSTPDLVSAQDRMARMPIYRRFPGPDTTRLDPETRFGSCGLNESGQAQLATMWVKALIEAERNKELYQKEALLNYFR
jgi:hypothetical protein